MKKRVLSLLLALVLMVGLLPTIVLAAESGTVDVYIIGRDELITYQQIDLEEAAKVDVSEYSASTAAGCTALHAIAAALQAEHLLEDFVCTGGYITEIGDLVAGQPNYMSGWMYKLNNVFPDVSVAQSTLKNGDELILFWEQGLENQQYCQFDIRKTTVKTGEKLTLSVETVLLNTEDGLGKELTFEDLKASNSRMLIYVDGQPYPEKLINSSNAALYFSAPGTHVVTAKVCTQGKEFVDDVLTMPVCVVTVTGDALPLAGGLKSLTITSTSGDFSQKVELKNGVVDYELDVPYEVETLKFTAEYDELALKNSSYIQYRFVNTGTGLPMVSKTSNTSGTMVKCLRLGENEAAIFVQCDPVTHAYTTICLHVNRSSVSSAATLTTLGVELGPDEMGASAENDLTAGAFKLHYQKDDGSTAFCTPTKLDASARDYTVYLPYETEYVQLNPVVTAVGTYVLTDKEGNTIDSSLIKFSGERQIITISTTSSDGTGHDTYTLTFVRRPNASLTDASIDCGYLWVPGVVPGYDELMLFITDAEAQEYTAKFTATAGTKIYLGNIAEERLLADGSVTRAAPKSKNNSNDYFTLLLVRELEDGSNYVRKVEVNVRENQTGLQMVEYVASPSQHMNSEPYDSDGGGMLSAFGGYVTYHCTEPIENDPANPYGIDFVVSGNPNYPNVWSFQEPAQVYVAQDKDGDGEPDKWYALAGSEHYEDTTYWDYQITYTDEGNRKVRWEDNYGGSGYVCGLSTGSAFPSAKVQMLNSAYRTRYQSGVLQFDGILLGPVKSENMIYAPLSIFGYGDCYPFKSQTIANPYRDPGLSSLDPSLTGEALEKELIDLYGASSRGDGMDISWAVDEDGEPIYLDNISFIKLVSAINVDAGTFSEKSPEIMAIKRITSGEENVGISELPDSIAINGTMVDLSGISVENGQAAATVYLQPGETTAEITVEAGDRNVILGNRYRKSYTYETISDEGRMVRIITQDGEKAPNILVLTIRKHGPEKETMDQIDAIGTVTLNSRDAIDAAREAYDALTRDQKALVTNYDVLTAAEARFAQLKRQTALIIGTAISGGSEPKAEFPFTDVPENAWYYDEVKSAWENGLVDGTNGTEYRPENTLTVAQAIKLAAALHQLDNEGRVTLTNGRGYWYDSYVEYAVYYGIIEAKYAGYTLEQMNAAITRAEFVHIFHGAMSGYYACNAVAENAIPDVKSGDAYADEIYEFYRAGILTGSDGKGTFHPESSIKRSEVAAILIRMYDTNARQAISLG